MMVWNNITKIWYNFKYGITNLIKWFPVIWMDRDWDYQYFYKITRKKLKGMENLHRFHGHHVDDIIVANQIKTCISIIDRLIEDDYNSVCFDKYFNKWGHPYYIKEDKWGMKREKSTLSKEDEIRKKEEFQICINRERELKLKDKELLFKTITDNIDSWWD